MLKRFKYIDATAGLIKENNQASTETDHCSDKNISAISGLSYIKLIKTEPIDLEMAYVESNDLKEYRLENISQTNLMKKSKVSETVLKSPITPSVNYQHVQIQTVQPRQPGVNLLNNNNTMQKVTLTPRLEVVNRSTSNDRGSDIGNIIRHVYSQQPISRDQSQYPHSLLTSSRIEQRVLQCQQPDSITGPQIIISRQPSNVMSPTPIQRRHSASPSQCEGEPSFASSSNNSDCIPSSPPPSIRALQQYSSNCSPQPSPPPLSLQNHVRVIRDGRIYEEAASRSVQSSRQSDSPPPLLHHHQSRSATVSPVVPRRYSISPQDTPTSTLFQQHTIEKHQGHTQVAVNNKKHEIHLSDTLGHYQRNKMNSPPLPSSTSLQTSSVITTDPSSSQVLIETPSATPSNSQSHRYALSSSARKYIVTTNTHQSGSLPTSILRQQHVKFIQRKHQISQYQEDGNTSLQLTAATSSSTSPGTRNFRIPVVTSSSRCTNISNNDQQFHSHTNTAMRPPPPPPPKIKNTCSSITLANSNNNGGNSTSEEPSSSIPDLENLWR